MNVTLRMTAECFQVRTWIAIDWISVENLHLCNRIDFYLKRNRIRSLNPNELLLMVVSMESMHFVSLAHFPTYHYTYIRMSPFKTYTLEIESSLLSGTRSLNPNGLFMELDALVSLAHFRILITTPPFNRTAYNPRLLYSVSVLYHCLRIAQLEHEFGNSDPITL